MLILATESIEFTVQEKLVTISSTKTKVTLAIKVIEVGSAVKLQSLALYNFLYIHIKPVRGWMAKFTTYMNGWKSFDDILN